MDMKTLRSQDASMLKKELTQAQTRLKELRFKRSSNQLKNVREIRSHRRLIARILTLLSSSPSSQEPTTTA